eukprot:Skav234972  [mRNA]  locus=scaffold122:36136:45285:+ [translate_table: standard]
MRPRVGANLLNIEYIDVAELTVSTIELISEALMLQAVTAPDVFAAQGDEWELTKVIATSRSAIFVESATSEPGTMPLPTVAVASDVSKALKADESELKDAEMLPAVAVEGEAATHVPEAQKAVAVEEAATHVDIEAQEKDESKVDAEEDAVADAAEATEAKPKRRAGPAALRSRVLAELAKSSAEDVRRRLEAELVEETKKAQEELKKRAKDARQQMRDLEKAHRKHVRKFAESCLVCWD